MSKDDCHQSEVR